MKKQLLFGFLIAVLGVVGFYTKKPAMAASARIVTVYADGESKTVATQSKTVGGALRQFDIQLGEHDKTEPALDEEIRGANFTINVYRARPITVVDGPNNYTVLTAERSPAAIVKDTGFKIEEEDELIYRRSDDSFAGTPGTQMVIVRSKNIIFSLYGKKSKLNTRAETIQDLLDERGVKLEEKDEVNLPLATRLIKNMTVSIDSVTRNLKTVEEPVPFGEEQIEDAQQPIDYRKIKQPGENGRKLVTYEIVIKNNGKPQKIVKKQVITKQPTKQIVIVGAKQWSGSLEQWLSALRNCESGGNYAINTGNGYYGAYQFSLETWRRIAPKVGRPELANKYPHEARPVDQDFMIIQNTKLSSGGLATQNPGCYRSTGISQFPPS